MSAWRLLIHPPADGAWNMAVDEAILDRYAPASRAIPPTLRLYSWNPAALSLGKSQAAADFYRPEVVFAEGLDLVRRPTGGLAVLHGGDRTYSVIGQLRREPFPGGVTETYRRVAEALVLALRKLGLDPSSVGEPTRPQPAGGSQACFDSTSVHEISVRDRKVIGSAQLRRRGAFLQHGSILLRSDGVGLAGAVGGPVRGRFGDLEQALGRLPDVEKLHRALVVAFEETFGIELQEGELAEGEAERAARLRCWKYDSVSWTFRGRLGERERRWGPLLVG